MGGFKNMRINKCNSEGYPDPTAYEAITSIVIKEKQAKRKKY